MKTDDATSEPFVASRGLRAAGWALHLYTAFGTVLALVAVIAAIQGETIRALWVLLAALVIDGTDGMLARRLRVKETIPGFDGARLDDIVDYLTYAFAPMVILWTGHFLPAGAWGVVLAAIPLVASGFQFCRTDAKTEDHYFLGFPSYWNVVAFYAVVLDLTPAVTAVILVACAIGVFVPITYIYPSRTTTLRGLNVALATVWLALYAVILATMPRPALVVIIASLGYIAYYFFGSVYLTFARRPSARRLPAEA